MATNEYLKAIDEELDRALDTGSPDAFISRFGFSVPSAAGVEAIAERSPDGVIEIGAGTGAWARALSDGGVSVLATDPHPAPSTDNEWFAHTEAYFEIAEADHTIAGEHPRRTLLLSWPTRTRSWPYEALSMYHDAGGRRVAYIGEPVGGHTGDDVFHRLLGDLTRCRQCDDGDDTAPCVCDFKPLWRLEDSVDLTRLPTHHDELRFYRRRRRRPW
ncbi:MAG: hypothetical protein ACK5O2_07565 [Microthrixaceae bacterium]